MTNNNSILCSQCDSLVYYGLSAPQAGSYLDCESCGFTLTFPTDRDIDTSKPPHDQGKGSEEAGLETLTPIEEVAAKAPDATTKAAANGAAPVTTLENFKFTGTASEYFKIWIVNVALTIVTLGIYSAWAKVRTNRYFYGNTRVAGSTFEYHADPVKILIGRVIVFIFFGTYNLVTNIKPMAAIAFSLLFMFVIPWFVVKSMKFRARNSSYRNIRFNFEATYREALNIFVGYGILSTITLGIAYPHFAFKRKEFTIGHSRYGTTPFKFSARSWSFYKIYLKGLLLVILLIGATIGATMGAAAASTSLRANSQIVAFVPMIIMAAFYLLIFAFIKTSVDNLSFSHTTLGSSRLESNMRVRDMLWIYISNAVLIIVTLGLMTPWAKIRSKRYKIEHLHLHVGEDFEAFIADEAKEASTLGEEALDFLDFDIGL